MSHFYGKLQGPPRTTALLIASDILAGLALAGLCYAWIGLMWVLL